MTENVLHDKMQSACKTYHSTETALLHVRNDILMALDEESEVFLALINISAASDTVDHYVLLTFLKETIDINDKSWNRFQSHLIGHTQQVCVDNVVSGLTELVYGVPNGIVWSTQWYGYGVPNGMVWST